jgi:hypothetical protein
VASDVVYAQRGVVEAVAIHKHPGVAATAAAEQAHKSQAAVCAQESTCCAHSAQWLRR